jgi:hypothetical protein
MMLLNGVENILSCHPTTLRTVRGMALPCQITSSANRACEWSVTWHCTIELHCSVMSTRLTGDDDTTCPLILQVP